MDWNRLGPELTPANALPRVHRVSSIDPALCRQYAKRALPMMMAAANETMFGVCDRDPALSDMTQAILGKVVETTGAFEGPAFASVVGYNLPTKAIGKAASRSYHPDGCEDVAIISTSARASLCLAWMPLSDRAGRYFSHGAETDTDGSVVRILHKQTTIGHIIPTAIVDCVPGTVVRINEQTAGEVEDSAGVTWGFMHGLYGARGRRVALQFRSFGDNPKYFPDGTGRVIKPKDK